MVINVTQCVELSTVIIGINSCKFHPNSRPPPKFFRIIGELWESESKAFVQYGTHTTSLTILKYVYSVWAGIAYSVAHSVIVGRSGDRIPVGGEVFGTLPDRTYSPSNLLCNGYRVIPGSKAAWA
jgi:hypothetical protein